MARAGACLWPAGARPSDQAELAEPPSRLRCRPWRFDGRDGRHSPWFEPTHNNSIESETKPATDR